MNDLFFTKPQDEFFLFFIRANANKLKKKKKCPWFGRNQKIS